VWAEEDRVVLEIGSCSEQRILSFRQKDISDMVLYRILARSRNSWQTEKAAGYVLEIVQCVPSRSRVLFPFLGLEL
jgi:hypothetical protein